MTTDTTNLKRFEQFLGTILLCLLFLLAAGCDNNVPQAGNSQATETPIQTAPDVSPTISEPSGAANSDAELKKKIQDLLKAETNQISSADVQVTTRGGQVILRGSVATEAEKEKIETKVASVAGADNVDNQLQVKE